ncbi:MAG: phosphotriesterase-related protein [Candidatus Dadabacteria bacterium]|nr:MAG: phosphotriesterase-related protein [Candidatus Dadabacteria bacterium]
MTERAPVQINTVTGTITPDELGRTLMHEHLQIAWPGWESDTLRPGPAREEILAVAVDRIQEMQDHGVRTMIDPCPNDLGRDVELMAEAAARTGLQIICATGLYKEDQGGAPYWKFRAGFGATPESIAELFIHELTVGIGSTGIKAGIIKVATATPAITEYERSILVAAAIASRETGAPITTHTDEGKLGDEQQKILTENGVPPHRIIIGHSCGSADFDYHMRIARGGSYLGFDRFGIVIFQPDEVRVSSLKKLLDAGAGDRVVVSHDSVWCWRGEPLPDPGPFEAMLAEWTPTHFFARIVPKLREAGASDEQIERLVVDNPRRFFAGGALPPLP